MMNKGIGIIYAVIILIALLAGSGALYTVDETQQAIVTQFGKLIGRPITQAGLYFKLPWQTVNYFEKRILQWDGAANQIPTREKRLIWVDTTARWRIADSLKFMQSVRTEQSAQTRLDDIIDASTRDIISSHNLIEAIRDTNRLVEVEQQEEPGLDTEAFGKIIIDPIQEGREELSRKILARAAETVPNYGIELIDMRIKRINYVQEVRNKVYERMISERKRAAEQFRSEGQGKKAEIEGQMAKELEQIQSEAYRQAQEIMGKADAEATRIYADAYNKDPDFYAFIKTLDTYRNTVSSSTTLMLSTKNEFYHQIEGAGLGSAP